MLPDEIVAIIKEYSMPITNPKWKTLHQMTQEHFMGDIEYTCTCLILFEPLTYANYRMAYLLASILFKME